MEAQVASQASIWMSSVAGTSRRLLCTLRGLQPAGLPPGWRRCRSAHHRFRGVTRGPHPSNPHPEHCQPPRTSADCFWEISQNIYQPKGKQKTHTYILKNPEKYPNAPRRMFDPWHTILMGWISKIKATLEGYYGFYRTTTKMGRKKARRKKTRELPRGAASQGR